MKVLITVTFLIGIGFVVGQFVQINTLVTPQDPTVLVTTAYRNYEGSSDNPQSPSVEKAISYCNQALGIDPQNLSAYRLLADIHMRRADYFEAMVNWKRLMDLQTHQKDVNKTIEAKIRFCMDQLIRQKFRPEEINSFIDSEMNSLKMDLYEAKQKLNEQAATHQNQIAELQQTINSSDKKMIKFQKDVRSILLILENQNNLANKERIISKLENLSDTRFVRYIIKPGDTFGKIAASHGISPSELQEYNSVSDPNKISPGEPLFILAHQSQ